MNSIFDLTTLEIVHTDLFKILKVITFDNLVKTRLTLKIQMPLVLEIFCLKSWIHLYFGGEYFTSYR